MSTEPGDGSAASADESISRWSALMSVLVNWRDWNLPVKLAAVTLVPIVFAIVLGTMQISDQVDKASSYRRVDRLVAVNGELRILVGALQAERESAGVLLSARAADLTPQLADEQRATDTSRAAFLRDAGRVTLDNEIAAARYADVLTWLDELTDVRKQVTEPGFEAANAITRYSAVIDTLLRFDRTMAAEALDPTLSSTASALYDLEAIKEEVAYQQAVVAVGVVRGSLSGPERDALAESVIRQADLLSDFYAVAGASRSQLYDEKVSGTGVASRNNVVAAVVASPPGLPMPTTAKDWQAASALTTNRLSAVADTLGADLRTRSAALQDEASDGAGLAAVILLVALVVAIAVMFIVGRHLLASLAALRRSALDVAERALPAAVARIRDRGENAGVIELPPVPVRSLDEVGQVARAFDAVQRQALKLATEQAGLRAKYSSVFVNLSRRSQGLVQRQLQLLERLERDEEDADQLATLFQLDHLATRMRRNNENLMVLSGTEVGRRAQRPTSLADLLRASVSEIEQYQRVVLLPPPNIQVVGYAVGDLVRLVAELLDNATAFSAPDTQVTIASHSFEDGSLCIAVLDDGIGMSQAELDEANHKLADSGSIDVSTSRRMGLFVIGRLAGRHGIEVRLNVGHDVAGVRATVTVPSDVVVPTGAEPVAAPRQDKPATGTSLLAPFSLGGVNGHRNGHTNGVNGHRNGVTPSPLPRRTSVEDIGRRLDDATAAETTIVPERTEPTGDGRTPLPRRSPGVRMPGQKSGPGDVAQPRGPFEPPTQQASPADGLFTPTDERASWWAATDRAAIEETTPIFDEMASAWFRAVTDKPAVDSEPAVPAKPQPPRQDEQQSAGEAWNFAADSGFDAARAVSNAEPSDFTTGGLPRRSPRQNLVPGSAAPGTTGDAPRHGRDADDVRTRLSDYRHGVRRARDHRRGVEPPSTPSATPVIPPRPTTRRKPKAPDQTEHPTAPPTATGQPIADGQLTANGQPTATGQSAGNGQPTANGQSAGNGQSTANGQSGRNERSTANEQSAENSRPATNGRSTAKGRSSRNGQSAGNAQPAGNGQSAENGQPTANGQSGRNGQSAENGRSTASGQFTENGQSPASGQSAGNGQSAANSHSAGSSQSAASGQPATNSRSTANGRFSRNGQSAGNAQPAGNEQSTASGQSAGNGQSAANSHSAGSSQSAASGQPATNSRSTANGRSSRNGQSAGNAQPAGNEQSTANGQSGLNEQSAGNGQPAASGHSAGNSHSAGGSQSAASGQFAENSQPATNSRSTANGRFSRNGQSAGNAQPAGNEQSTASGQPAANAQPVANGMDEQAAGSGESTANGQFGLAARRAGTPQSAPGGWVESVAQTGSAAQSAPGIEAGWSAWSASATPPADTPALSTSDAPDHSAATDHWGAAVHSGTSGHPGAADSSDTADTTDATDASIAETAQLDLSGAGWRFAADIGWRAANQVSTATPVDFTSGGLPRRSPRQNLVPGSVSHSGNGNGASPPRVDRAEEMRGRLGSFQSGLSRGRRSLAERSPVNGFHDKQQQESE